MNDLQKKQLDILKAFISVCEKHHLQYFLVGGSTLGAIRHKGFIPWDDDIDVGMPRKDYDEFIKLQHEFNGTPYFIQNFKYSDFVLDKNLTELTEDKLILWNQILKHYANVSIRGIKKED